MAGRQKSDTIAAVATPPGTGGIGIVRISGPQSLSILRRLFRPHRSREILASHVLYYGTIVDGTGSVIDEVLAVFMRAPHTYTREDVVEIHSHGSYLVLNSILTEVLRNGARPAEPGEFTKRAFLAGRIDLTRAEAVVDLLRARTDAGVRLAVGQLQGEMYRRVEAIRESLVDMLAVLEVAIDFPEDDVELLDHAHLLGKAREEVISPLTGLINMADQGKIIRDGISLVIVGLPNVGKSSLLNGLLREERALVTSVPGTTRDTIEEYISIHGVPVRLVDTAGIRAHAGSIEEMGIQRARRKMEEADVVLFMVDAARPLTAEDMELFRSIGRKPRIVVLNKMDIADREAQAALEERFAGETVVRISARNLEGLQELQETVFNNIAGGEFAARERFSCAPNTRHRIILEESLAAVRRLEQGLEENMTADLAAVEVQAALDHLGDIVGLTTPDDVLDRIFAEFCIGK
ncbi:MAG: tRNA uridine-5-carboxymethylaminomethyl(34) synthesis GTPase MnmE [Desulfobulbaceae bacterium]